MSDTEKDKEPSLGEKSGKQDWYRAGALIAAGMNIGAGFISPASNAGATRGGVYLNGAPLNGVSGTAYGSVVPTAALLGTGTLEGTNKYSPPILGGPGPYGLVPGFIKPWPGTYATYRIASAHPTHVIAGASLVGQVLGSQWSYESKRNAPSGARALIQETLEPSRTRLLIECLKAVTTFGYRAFEKVFEVRDGMVRLVKLKPLLPELTDILVDDKGNFAGVRNTGVELGADKVFIYTYDQDGDYFYGRPRLENTRRAWSNWLNTEDQLGRLGGKTSSIIPIMRYPPGQGFDSLGQPRTNYSIAVAMAAGLASGRPIVVPNLAGLQIEDYRNLADFADKSLWGIDTVDMGNPGPAIEALLRQLQYYDSLMVRGMLRPERSLLEQSRGGASRADSQTHADIGISDSDMVHADIVAAINEQVVNALLVYNFGEEARDTVRIKPAPLADDKQLLDRELLGGLIKTPQGLARLIAHTDMEAWMDRVGLPKNEAAREWDGRMAAPAQSHLKTGENAEQAPTLNFGRDDPPATSPTEHGHWITKDGNHIFIADEAGAGGSPNAPSTSQPSTKPNVRPATQPSTRPSTTQTYALSGDELFLLQKLDPELADYLGKHPEITIMRPVNVQNSPTVAGHTEGNVISIKNRLGTNGFVETLIHELLHHRMGRAPTRAEHLEIYKRQADSIIKNGRQSSYPQFFTKNSDGKWELDMDKVNKAIDREIGSPASNPATQP